MSRTGLGRVVSRTGLEVPFGFRSAAVRSGATAELHLQPASTFKADRLRLADEIASSFELLDFRVGPSSFIWGDEPVDGELFADSAADNFFSESRGDMRPGTRGVKLPTIRCGQAVTMVWRNRSDSTVDLVGNLWGAFVADEKEES